MYWITATRLSFGFILFHSEPFDGFTYAVELNMIQPVMITGRNEIWQPNLVHFSFSFKLRVAVYIRLALGDLGHFALTQRATGVVEDQAVVLVSSPHLVTLDWFQLAKNTSAHNFFPLFSSRFVHFFPDVNLNDSTIIFTVDFSSSHISGHNAVSSQHSDFLRWWLSPYCVATYYGERWTEGSASRL